MFQSLRSQRFDSYEVVCVDDGSSDGTLQMLERIALVDDRFKVVHQQHLGPSAARNSGLAHSAGQYVAFVDADDAVSPLYLPALVALAEKTGADVVCCDHRESKDATADGLFDDCGGIGSLLAGSTLLDAGGALREIAQGTIGYAFWGKLIKRELMAAHPFPDFDLSEDIWNLGEVISDASSIACTPETLYCYVLRRGSQSRRKSYDTKHFAQFREAVMQFERDFATGLRLDHATDDPSWCLYLVHRLCGQFGMLRRTSYPACKRAAIEASLLDELRATRLLALKRGVPASHPQMIRAALLLRCPKLHDVALGFYRKFRS